MKMAFKECNYTIDETKDKTTQESILTKDTQNQIFWIIGSVFVITIVIITVIVGVMYVLKRRKEKPKMTSQSGVTQSTEKSYPVYPKGSITDDIDRYHNRFIQTKTESTASTKTFTNKASKSKPKASIKPSDIKPKRRVSPPKKTSVKSPKRTFAKTKLI